MELTDWERVIARQRAALTRRTVLRGTLGLAMVGLLAACGGDDEGDATATSASGGSSDSSSTPTSGAGGAASEPAATAAAAEPTATTAMVAASPTAAGSPSAGGAAFPQTFEHKFGSTTLEAAPARIALVGLTEQDALLALGVVPVVTREWFGEHPGAVFPWAAELLGDAPVPVVLDTLEIDFEQVIAAQPDLIVGLYAGLTQEEYDTLAAIAPTIAQPVEFNDWGTSPGTRPRSRWAASPASRRRPRRWSLASRSSSTRSAPSTRSSTARAVRSPRPSACRRTTRSTARRMPAAG